MKTSTTNKKNKLLKLTKVLAAGVLMNLGLAANAQCTASFISTVNPSNNGEVSFTNTSSAGAGLFYDWNFGDGTHDYNATPSTHTYSYTGVHLVSLTIYDSLGMYNMHDSINNPIGGCYNVFYDMINIANISGATCNANYAIASDSSGYVTFVSTSTGNITNYLWDFGDGTTSTNSSAWQQHVYSSNGTFNVCLTTSNSSTQCNSQHCGTVLITGASSCHVSFTQTLDNTGGGVTFTPNSASIFDYYNWYFDDGTSFTGPIAHHVFSSNGLHNVCLQAFANAPICADTMCQSVYINGLCDAGFYVHHDSTNLFNYIISPNTYSTALVNYLWDFGDGSTSTSQVPTHTYAGSGPYQICLTVNDGNGCMDTKCDSIFDSGRASGIITINVQLTTGIKDESINNASLANYPNPFVGITSISFTVNQTANVELSVVDLLGNKIAVIESENKLKGNYKTDWNSENIAEGIYILQLKVGNQLSSKKIVVAK
jgi:PKD repeat protein